MKYELVAAYTREDGKKVQEILPNVYSSKKDAASAQVLIDQLNQAHPEVRLFLQPIKKIR